MTEKEFWKFLNNEWSKGRPPQISAARLDSADPYIRETGRYFDGHTLLPRDYEEIPAETIAGMGELLLSSDVQPSTKEAIMIILAHHGSAEALRALTRYNENPDLGLEIYARLALDECEMWNEE